MAEINGEWIESAAELARELAAKLSAATDEEAKDEALTRLNLVLNDIARAARGEEGGEVNVGVDCCSLCYQKYYNDPVKYRNCVTTCNRGC